MMKAFSPTASFVGEGVIVNVVVWDESEPQIYIERRRI